MFYCLYCTDKPGSLQVRLDNRPTHLAYIESLGARLVTAGPLLGGADAQTPIGSLIVLDCANRSEAEAVAAADPYAVAGLFESVLIRPWRRVFPKA
ncbi:MAG: YciI family protein [Rhodospirillaceae bacterium]